MKNLDHHGMLNDKPVVTTKHINHDKDIRDLENILKDIEKTNPSSDDEYISLKKRKLDTIDKIYLIKLDNLVMRFTNIKDSLIDDARIGQLRDQFLAIMFEWIFKKFKDFPTPITDDRSIKLANAIIQTTRSVIDKQPLVDKATLKIIIRRFMFNLFNNYTVDNIDKSGEESIFRYI
jgi:hypothetical protein